MPMRCSRPAVPLALLGLALAAAPARAAAPLAGAHYAGHSAQAQIVDFGFGAGNTKIAFYSFAAKYHCNRKAYRYATWGIGRSSFRGSPPTVTVSHGAFGKTFTAASSLQNNYATALPKGHGRFRFSGRFGAPRIGPSRVSQTARGTLRASFRGPKGLHCMSGPVKWAATATEFRARTGSSAVGHCRAYVFQDRAANGHEVYAISIRRTSCTSTRRLATAAWAHSPNGFSYHGFTCTARGSPSGTPTVTYACRSGTHRARFKIS